MALKFKIKPPKSIKCIDESSGANKAEDKTVAQLVKAFKGGTAQGLFTLAAQDDTSSLTPSGRFWRQFASLYMRSLCQTPSNEEALEPIELLPEEFLGELCSTAPPMIGGEYLSVELLENLWQQLNEWVCHEVNSSNKDLEGFLKAKAPRWHQVGRVFFHLAENKNDPNMPFAFMSTYVEDASSNLTHKPLGQALKQYAGTKNKKALVSLLNPVQLASTNSKLINELVESGSIYRPHAWTCQQAYAFLKEIPVYEESGVLVKIPDWWKKRPRPQVKISVGSNAKSNFSASTLLDFDVELVLDDKKITAKEWKSLMESEENLVLIRGQWIEVDKEKLSQALDHWKTVEKIHEHEGLTFAEGMRLLAGASDQIADQDEEDQYRQWAFSEAGPGLQKILNNLADPEAIKKVSLGSSLKATLRPYQETGVNWLNYLTQLGLGACLADDMGLGKTIQVISLLLARKKNQTVPSLLIIPTSLLNNWKSEIEKFAPSLKTLILHSSFIKKGELSDLEPQVNKVNAAITTYGTLLRQDWLLEKSWDLVILDEAQAIKNPNSSQTKKVKQLKAQVRLALTGTPVENHLSDLWSLFDFISPGLLGDSKQFKAFTKTLEQREEDQYGPLRRLVKPYILRRLKTDKSIISDLPDKTEVDVFCNLSKKQASLYSKSVNDLAKALEDADGIKRRGIILSFLTRLKQICNHPSQLLGDGEYDPKKSGKFDRLKTICEEISERQEKVLIFTQYREMTKPLAEYMESIFGQRGLVLHGGTSTNNRKKYVDDFQNEDGPPFFILSLKAGGTGLNLTAASHVIHFDRWWNPAVENQATDRAFRIGQKNNVLVHKFICTGTVEEKVDELIKEKIGISSELLKDGQEKSLTEMGTNELMELVTLDLSKAAI